MTHKEKLVEITAGSAPPATLHLLPLARSRYGLPAGYEQAHLAFAQAREEYEGGKPAKAAPKFIAVAALVKAPPEKTTYSAQFAKMRVAAYRDAAIAYREADLAADAKKALGAALKQDPENAAELQALLKGFQ